MSTALARTAATELSLPGLIDRAVATLANARTAAEVLEARDIASFAYDAAKKAARLGKAKQAHDDVIAAAYRSQADALEIEAQAKRRLADEYDAAQERGEVAEHGGARNFKVPNENVEPSAAALGLSRKDIHEGRALRAAENADPGIVRRTVDAAVEAGEEPSKAKVRRAVLRVVKAEDAPKPKVRGPEAICNRVREAIVMLSGLPPAHEVTTYFRSTDAAIVVSENLAAAALWLAEFAAAWRQAQNADNTEG